MKVISLEPQEVPITSGPYRFARNPLYLGGNLFIFFGASLVLGSPSGLFITAMHLPFVDFMIRREEKQLEKKFGPEWIRAFHNKALEGLARGYAAGPASAALKAALSAWWNVSGVSGG
jgi:Phospholipid methyltransferase